jgi:hypothetical protein
VKVTPVLVERGDVVGGRDVALPDVVDELLVDDRMCLEEPVVGLLQPELREVADGEPERGLEHLAAHGERGCAARAGGRRSGRWDGP